MVLCKHYFAYSAQAKNLTLESFQLCLLVFFLIELVFLSNISTFSRNFNHHWKCREQKQNFRIIEVIIFWNFTIFQYSSDSLQVKRNFISSIANLVYELPHELPNEGRLRILENQEILEKSQVWVGKSLVPRLSSRNLTLVIAVKNHAKMDIKLTFSCPVLLDFSILFQIFCPGLWFLQF